MLSYRKPWSDSRRRVLKSQRQTKTWNDLEQMIREIVEFEVQRLPCNVTVSIYLSQPNAALTLACEKLVGSNDTVELQTQALISIDM